MGGTPAAGLGLDPTAMAGGRSELDDLLAAIVAGDEVTAQRLLATNPDLATERVTVGATRADARSHFLDAIGHYVYAGDTALHVAAAAHGAHVVSALTEAGADVGAANRRGAQPLHYAVDGGPNSPVWDPEAQAETVRRLVRSGADPNAVDRNGTTPLHRAVRNRCAAAVEALLSLGADAQLPNGRGSRPAQLAQWTTGKGGSGSPAAKEQQARIVQLLEAHGAVFR